MVCNYYPHGNVIDTFYENVLPPPTIKDISTTFFDYEEGNEIKLSAETIEEPDNEDSTSNLMPFHKSCLIAHNKYRALHGCPSLHLSPDLCHLAYDWAKVRLVKSFDSNLLWR